MKHHAHFVEKGATRLVCEGHWKSLTSIFRNPDGKLVITVQNPLTQAKTFAFEGAGKSFEATLEAHSFNTFVL